jgi:hypothetical protein
MFMAGCAPELEAKRHRIACRQIIMRNVLAAAAGVRRTLYWNLAPEVPGPVDPYVIMHLLIGKLPLLDYRSGRIETRYPEADAFERVAGVLNHAVRVERADVSECPTVHAFRVERVDATATLVLWERRDPFLGESADPVPVTLPWSGLEARIEDAFGNTRRIRPDSATLRLRLTDTPLFVTGDVEPT